MNDTGILGHVILVNANVRTWEAHKYDRQVTQRVNDEYAASREAGRWNKHLFGGKVEELSAVQGAVNNLRATHYAHTLPWSEDGWRMLTTENVFEYRKAMKVAVNRFEKCVEALLKKYTRLVADAKVKLNGMYRESDYPTLEEVKAKYSVKLDYSPVPDSGAFAQIVQLSKKQMDEMARDVEDRVAESVQAAMVDAWKRLGDAVSHLRERLDDGKHLRDTMFERLQELAGVLSRLNITRDPALDAACRQVMKDLTSHDAETLRKDDKARESAAAKADKILKQMQGLYAPAKEGK